MSTPGKISHTDLPSNYAGLRCQQQGAREALPHALTTILFSSSW